MKKLICFVVVLSTLMSCTYTCFGAGNLKDYRVEDMQYELDDVFDNLMLDDKDYYPNKGYAIYYYSKSFEYGMEYIDIRAVSSEYAGERDIDEAYAKSLLEKEVEEVWTDVYNSMVGKIKSIDHQEKHHSVYVNKNNVKFYVCDYSYSATLEDETKRNLIKSIYVTSNNGIYYTIERHAYESLVTGEKEFKDMIETVYFNNRYDDWVYDEETRTFKNKYTNEAVVLPTKEELHTGTKEKITFSDLPSTHWAYNDVMTIANKGIISGTTPAVNGVGTYDPDGTVTLGQFLAITTRLLAPDKIVEGNHSHWASKNYIAAVNAGLISDSDFAGTAVELNNTISRDDMAYILVNIAKANGETLEYKYGIENNIKDLFFADSNRRYAVLVAYSNGLLTGKGNNEFKPNESVTRAEVAAVFCRVMNYTTRPTVTVQQPQNQASKYLSYEGETVGLILPEYAREFDLQALNNVKFGEDEKGVYVEFTAPTLPDELKNTFKFSVIVDIEAPNGDYFCSIDRFNLKSGESEKKYFEHYDADYGTKVTKSMIGSASVDVVISPIEYNDYTVRHYVNSKNKTQAYERWFNNTGNANIDYNSFHIWSGIGK